MRAIWTGILSFGLVNIPIEIYSASNYKSLSFKLFDKKDFCPISYKKVCKRDGEEVNKGNIIKGYEYEKGNYVMLEDKDFEKANIEKNQRIEIMHFINESEINSKYYEKPYYIAPKKEAEKAYVLLKKALLDSGKIGIAKFVMHTKEHLGAIKAENEGIILNQLRFADEIRDPEELNLPKEVEFSEKELNLAKMIIENLTEHFEITKYHDTYTEDLKEIIAKKAKGKTIKPKGKTIQSSKMEDLMNDLLRSLDKVKK